MKGIAVLYSQFENISLFIQYLYTNFYWPDVSDGKSILAWKGEEVYK